MTEEEHDRYDNCKRGNIHSDFALDFKKNEACLIAADKGLEFFLEHQLLPDAVIGDFDSLSEDGKKFLEIHEERSMDSEIPYGGMTEWKLQKGFGNEKRNKSYPPETGKR